MWCKFMGEAKGGKLRAKPKYWFNDHKEGFFVFILPKQFVGETNMDSFCGLGISGPKHSLPTNNYPSIFLPLYNTACH